MTKKTLETFYNDNIKNDFLNQFKNEGTKHVYRRIFDKSKHLEEENGKDLLDFDEVLLELLFENYICPKTKQSARTYGNVIASYIQWGLDNGYRKNIHKSNNIISILHERQDYFTSFVKDQHSLYLSKDEIEAILFRLVNAQDSFIIQALFDGIQGKKVSELTLLTEEQLEEAVRNNNIITLIDSDGNMRKIKLDDMTINLGRIASREPEYYKKNGQVDFLDASKETIRLAKSKYVLKPTATSKERQGKPVSHYTVYNRLEMIKSLEEFEEYKESLNTKNIVRSGMLYEAKKFLDEGKELDRYAIEKICVKFGMSYKWSLRDFLNEETVNEVYA